MMVTTTDSVEGRQVVEYLGSWSGEAIIGADIKTVQIGWPLGMPLVRKLDAVGEPITGTIRAAPISAAFSMIDSISSSLRPGIIGPVMMPVATPPNAIVYGSGRLASRDMLRAGALLDLLGLLLVVGVVLTLGRWVFG